MTTPIYVASLDRRAAEKFMRKEGQAIKVVQSVEALCGMEGNMTTKLYVMGDTFGGHSLLLTSIVHTARARRFKVEFV